MQSPWGSRAIKAPLLEDNAGTIVRCNTGDIAIPLRPPRRRLSRATISGRDGAALAKQEPRGRSVSVSAEGMEYLVSFPPLFVLPPYRILVATILGGTFVAWACTASGAWLLEACGLSRAILLTYVSIPIVSTLFTYGHIWAALYMTFYPLEYVGCLQIPDTNAGCGWQGIVPNKAEKMARTSVKLMTEKLITTRDIFERIDPLVVAQELEPVIQTTLARLIDQVAMQEVPSVWSTLPASVKQELVASVKEDTPKTIQIMMDEIKQNIDHVFDLTTMVVSALTRDPDLQNCMFIECGYDELLFIRNFGAYMGFAFGVFQMTLWIFWSAGWMLPTFGLVVGCFSNWVALKMIFEPVEPYYLFGIEIQGRFLKRQLEVSEVYARIVSSKVLSARNIIPAVITGPCSNALFELVHKHIRDATDRYVDKTRTSQMLRFASGEKKFDDLKHTVGDSLVLSLPDTMVHAEKYFDKAMDLENLLFEKMSAMHPGDFERLLHPVFEEDEWKLVLMGGVLGVWVGCMQWYVLGG